MAIDPPTRSHVPVHPRPARSALPLAADGAGSSLDARLDGGAAELHAGARRAADDTEGNARLTAATGIVLVALLAVIGLTLLRLHTLLWVHLFVGMVLIPPVVLKLATTGYRFARYYTANPAYRRKGPPPALLRAIAPVVVLSTIVVLGTGVALLLIGPSSSGALLPIHKASFIVWIAFTALHVLGHLLELPEQLGGDYAPAGGWGERVRGRNGRVLALASALVAGVALAVLVIPDFGAWLHAAGVLSQEG
jgi:hypothetical protein